MNSTWWRLNFKFSQGSLCPDSTIFILLYSLPSFLPKIKGWSLFNEDLFCANALSLRKQNKAHILTIDYHSVLDNKIKYVYGNEFMPSSFTE
jgi:hypothetical protein